MDDLFGAFDGVEQEPSAEPESKKARVEEEQEGKDATRTTKIDTVELPEKLKSAYSAVMSAKSATRVLQTNDITRASTENVSKSEQSEKDREIATGTAHDKTVRSYSAYPKNLPAGHTPVTVETPIETAKTYAFELDPFQKQAIGFIDKEESVLVAAHTSAGKTAVAEYAIAKSLKQGQRVVYTSPIKALSNQKFRDLQEEFGNVGLMTGDITINPQATALVMTTEILRSMLYRGSELMREVAWVIYDEVHYMRDSERGVVWEESIILLPHRVRFVFLSATIPNASQFADWIAEIHHQPCHVVYTNYRPVPLQHYIFPQGGEGLHLVVDERGRFRESNFQRAMATMQSGNAEVASAEAMLESGNGKKKRGRANGRKGGQFNDLHRIVKLVMERNLNPVIVFSFSKKDCERYALALHQEDYTDDVEKDLIAQVYVNAIDNLCDDDKKLPQVEALLPLLKRGIGIHHGGLLPILKEIVEILFSEGLIKTLFATETFSIGINMPAKTVVFTNTRKWDGTDFRWVTSGEYIQMSGRAGRRGKDDRGIVIQMLDEKMEPAVCKDILYGAPDPLNSSYRISYNMLLNLMRVEDVDPEYLLRASFHQFQKERDAPALMERALELEKEAGLVDVGTAEEEELISQYYQMDQQLALTRRKIAQFMQKPEYILKYLQPGRLLDITIGKESFGWGVLVSCKKRSGRGSAGEGMQLSEHFNVPSYQVDVLLNCVDRHFDEKNKKGIAEDIENAHLLWNGSASTCRPPKAEDDNKLVSMRVFTIGFDSIDRLSAVKLHLPQDITLPEARTKVSRSLSEAMRRLNHEVPLLDPVADMGVTDEAFQTLLKRAETLTQRVGSHKFTTDFEERRRIELMTAFEKRVELQQQAKLLRDEVSRCQTISMKEDLKKMKRVLKKLGHVDGSGVIQTKGRAACEINTADELVVVELIFSGVFSELSPEQAVALMSCMTFGEKTNDEDDATKSMRNFLSRPFLKLQEIARSIAKIEIACGIDVDEDEFVARFNPGMVEPVYAWCKGAKFVEVQKLTGTFEGTTIRTLRRLEELIRQISVAAKAIGNQELQAKFEKGSDLIKRDIVFCSSLYL